MDFGLFNFLQGLFEIVEERRNRHIAWLAVFAAFLLLFPLILFLIWWTG